MIEPTQKEEENSGTYVSINQGAEEKMYPHRGQDGQIEEKIQTNYCWKPRD